MKASHLCSIVFLAALPFAGAAPATILASQTTARNRPSFEVASIRPNRSGGFPGPPYSQRGDRFTAVGVTLKMLIGYSYRVAPWQIEGGPGWVRSQLWNIEAKGDEKLISAASKPRDPFAPDVIALMLQTLLADRFKLRIQRQTREAPVYHLVVAKGWPKIELDEDQKSPPAHDELELRPDGGVPRGSIRMGPHSIAAHAVLIEDFINWCLLSRTDRPIVNRTNLKGLYSFKIQWSQEDSVLGGSTGPPSPIARVNTDFGAAFLTAMKEQLGLQLQSAKGPVDFIVIASVEEPSGN